MKKIQEEPIYISSYDDLILKKKDFVRHQSVKFICCDCEKEMIAQLRHIEQYPIRCGNHKNDERFKEKFKCMKENNVIILKKEECESFINFAKDLFKNFPKCFKLI